MTTPSSVCPLWSTWQRQTIKEKLMELELDAHHVQQNEDVSIEHVANQRFLFTLMCNHVFERELRDSQHWWNEFDVIPYIISLINLFISRVVQYIFEKRIIQMYVWCKYQRQLMLKGIPFLFESLIWNNEIFNQHGTKNVKNFEQGLAG